MSRRVGALALTLAGAGAAAGCSSYATRALVPPPILATAPVPPDLARVCVVRRHHLAALVQVVVRDNGLLVGATEGASYFCYYAAAGPHRITAFAGGDDDRELGTGGFAALAFRAEPAHAYFVDVPLGLLYGRDGGLAWLPPVAAAREVADLDYLVVSAVPEGEFLPALVPVVPAAGPTPAPSP